MKLTVVQSKLVCSSGEGSSLRIHIDIGCFNSEYGASKIQREAFGSNVTLTTY